MNSADKMKLIWLISAKLFSFVKMIFKVIP